MTSIPQLITTIFDQDTQCLSWLQNSLLNPDVSMDAINEEASEILAHSSKGFLIPNSKRYSFQSLSSTDILLKALFEKAFQERETRIIQEVEKLDGPSYPLWKRICWIRLPRIAGEILRQPLIKVIFCVILTYYSSVGTLAAYNKVKHLFAAYMIPWIINHTPLSIIHFGNRCAHVAVWTCKRPFLVVAILGTAQFCILRGPTLPYLTPIMQDLDLYSMFYALFYPSTLYHCVLEKAIDAMQFAWKQAGVLSHLCDHIALTAEQEQLNISKKKAETVWKRVLAETIPSIRENHGKAPL